MITMCCPISGGDFEAAGRATRGLREHLARVGVSPVVMRRAMIASYEAEMNVVIHARTGTLWARLDAGRLDLEVSDEGPGIPDIGLALQEGWSTAPSRARELGFGAGMGLPNIRKNCDRFGIETRVGRGTRIRAMILLRPEVPAQPGPEADGDREADGLRIAGGKCRACLRCLAACPTGALRVRGEGPRIREELCIGCTACAAACDSSIYGLARSKGEPLKDAVLVAPRGFWAGLPNLHGFDDLLRTLGAAGFAELRFLEEWEQAILREARTAVSGTGTAAGRPELSPSIPPLCPAVVALVESRFPALIPNLGPWLSPLEAAGEEFPLRPVVLLASCAAQYTRVRRLSLTDRLTVLSPEDLASRLEEAHRRGRQRGRPVLRAACADSPRTAGELAVTGPVHVLRALTAAEAGALPGVTLLDLWMCDHGCQGSPELVIDPFMAEMAWAQAMAWEQATAWQHGRPSVIEAAASDAGPVRRNRPYAQRHGMRLDPDMAAAIEALRKIDQLTRRLPGRDCGSCGAPSCASYAEDVIMNRAGSSSCPHVISREVSS